MVMHTVLVFCLAISLAFANYGNITVNWTGNWSCVLNYREKSMPCALGKNGISSNKVEGDGKTPVGEFLIRRAFYRADKLNSAPAVSPYLNLLSTQTNYGWVDEPTDPLYNQFVYLPYYNKETNQSISHENLYLNSSNVYDLMAVIGYNDVNIVPYAGSAIFFHVASDGYGATAGYVALSLDDLKYVLESISSDTYMIIH